MERYEWRRRIAALDPATEFAEMYRLLVAHEFPWDFNQSLSFALFRTYAVPSIGRLLAETGEFTGRVQKRYDDTSLILDAVLEHGFASATGRAAIRRMNQMHGSYPIAQDDLRYVLSTFVTMPIRWLDRYGWRRLEEHEKAASANYYRELGRHMAIPETPATWQAFAEHMDAYEAAHFAFDADARRVADATLRLLTSFPPNNWAPVRLIELFSRALMDDPLLEALRYTKPHPLIRAAAHRSLWLRGRVVRLLPPRELPRYTRMMPNIRSYPGGYDVDRLGTFPPGCPAHADGPQPQAGSLPRRAKVVT